MPSVFQLWGEIKANTQDFESSLRNAEQRLKATEQAIGATEARAKGLGQTSATTARQYEKLNERITQQRDKLLQAATAYQRGDISAKQFANALNSVGQAASNVDSRIKDSQARLTDFGNRVKTAGTGLSVFKGTLGALGFASLADEARQFATEGVKLFGTLDKLTRFTATLDKNFQSPKSLATFRRDIQQLSTEIPQSAESIAKASFTIKSAFQNLTQTELIAYLREFGIAATASNTDIASHAQNLAALAKQYNVTGNDLRSFSTLIASSFGQALASDSQVAQGFNQILNSAKSIKQPLADMVAAMSTLQSASSDASANTTLLLNVYSKLTDPKYIAGIQAMGVAVYDAAGNFRPLNQLINDMAKKLEGLSDKQVNDQLSWAKDAQAREGIKTLIRLVGDYNKQLSDGSDSKAFGAKTDVMLNSAEAKWQRFTNKIDILKMALGNIVVDIADIDLSRDRLSKELKASQERAQKGGFDIGSAIAIGMGQGMGSMMNYVASHARALAGAAITAAVSALIIQSPSKVFFGIGRDVGQGFIDGMAAMRGSVRAAMVSMLDISGIKGLSKNDAPGVELLSGLLNELARVNVESKLQEVLIDLTAGKYGKLNAAIRERIILAAREIDRLTDSQKLYESEIAGVKKLSEAWTDMFEPLNDVARAQKEVNALFSDPDVIASLAYLDQRTRELIKNTMLLGASIQGLKDVTPGSGRVMTDSEGTGLGGTVEEQAASIKAMQDEWDEMIRKMGKPPALDLWENFWAMMKTRIEGIKQSLPSMNEVLGENIIGAIEGISDVFRRTITQWDGTIGGFFRSVGANFVYLAKQITAELIKMLVFKALLRLFGSALGGIGGGGAGGGGGGSPGYNWGQYASGGMVRGPGSATSDSVFAALSNGEFVIQAAAVRKWGAGFFQQLNNLSTPQFAMAGGGMIGGGGTSSTYNNQRSNIINVHVSGGGSRMQNEQTGSQIGRAVIAQLRREETRNK